MINPMDLTGKMILVTGASSGIGRETCRCLSELGARVVLAARNKERLAATAATLEGTGHCTEPFDLSLVDQVPDWLQDVAKRLGSLDGVVHCAGISITQPMRLWNVNDTDRLMKINLYACFALASGLRRKLVRKKGSSLVLISSVGGIRGYPGLVMYSASKAAIIGLTRSLALELALDGVRVNCVAPGLVDTEMLQETRLVLTEQQIADLTKEYPLGIGKPRDVANSIAFLLSDASRWITGTTLVTDGGCTA